MSFHVKEHQDEYWVKTHHIHSIQVPHPVPAVALRIGDVVFVFSGDCSPNDELTTLALKARLLLIEATLPISELGHHSPYDAGGCAERAQVKEYWLVHRCDAYPVDQMLSEASQQYNGIIRVANAGDEFH